MLENNFWGRWHSLATEDLKAVAAVDTALPHSHNDAKVSLTVDACWNSLMMEAYLHWEKCAQQLDSNGNAPASNAILRKTFINAWMDLEIVSAIHEEAKSSLVDQQLEYAQLSRTWVIRCLQFFVAEFPVFFEEAAWQTQARAFIRGTQLRQGA